MKKPYGVFRVLNTKGRAGDNDEVLKLIKDCNAELAANPSCLSFHYGTQISGALNHAVEVDGVSYDEDPFTVWIFETWTSADDREHAFKEGNLAELDCSIAPYLEFEPEEGIRLQLLQAK